AACLNTFYIPQQVFLARESDMQEIAAAIQKVQNHFAPRVSRSKAPTQASAPPTKRETSPSIGAVGRPRTLRIGIVGLGAIGRNPAEVIASHRLLTLTAISDIRPETAAVARNFRAAWFESPDEMLGSGTLDAVVVATPHWQHSTVAIAALERGLHVV